jgi:hypothetical protein
MKCLLRPTVLSLAALAITSCATTSVVQVWRDPDFRPVPIKRVLIVGVIPYAADRLAFENAIAQALIKKDFEVATSSGVVPPGQPFNDKIDSYAKRMGVDLVVVVRLVAPYGAWYGTTDINVYAAKIDSEWPVWSGTSYTSNFSTAQEAATSVAAALLYGLMNAQILAH